MKTTVDLPETLLKRARAVAMREHTTIRALIEECLRRILKEREAAPAFKLESVTFGGQGLSAEARGLTWSEILEMSYGARRP